MNILHINFSDNSGGAARSAYKIHSGLKQQGCTSRMLVRLKVTDDPDVDYIYSHKLWIRMGDLIGKKIIDKISLPYLYNPSSFELVNHSWFKSSDVIQLYNLHAPTCFFTYRALPKISSLKPVVWRLSDMWPFTGHCSYSHECERWKTGCGSCPYLHEYPAIKFDNTALLWKIKKWVYQHSKLFIVTTNSWMEKLVCDSPLLSQFPVYRIPNGIDTYKFKPIQKQIARTILNLPVNSKIVLFAAYDTTETRKGGQYIPDIMERLAAQGISNLVLVVIGKGSEFFSDHPKYQTIRLQFSNSDEFLTNIYSATDVLIHPAIVENFPNTILECMACSTPCVAFDVGGVSDIVRHLQTGYLAQYKDIDDMVKGIYLLLDNFDIRLTLSNNCRTTVETEYTLELQALKHLQLYSHILSTK